MTEPKSQVQISRRDVLQVGTGATAVAAATGLMTVAALGAASRQSAGLYPRSRPRVVGARRRHPGRV